MRNNFNMFLSLEQTSTVVLILSQENDEEDETGERVTYTSNNNAQSAGVQRMTSRIHAVGFYLIKGTALQGDLVSDSEFHRSQEIFQRLDELPAGDYTIIPTCLESNTHGTFTITAYADSPVTLRVANKKGSQKPVEQTLEQMLEETSRPPKEVDATDSLAMTETSIPEATSEVASDAISDATPSCVCDEVPSTTESQDSTDVPEKHESDEASKRANKESEMAEIASQAALIAQQGI